MKLSRALRLPLLIALLALAPLVGRAAAFLGPIPVQYLKPGEELVLDMHRFYQPVPGGTLAVGEVKGCTTRFDADRCELRVSLQPDAPTLLDVPLTVTSGNSTAARSVLTLVTTPPPSPGNDRPAPTIYAERIKGPLLALRAAPAKLVSAVWEQADGAWPLDTTFMDDGTLRVRGLPDHRIGFVRVVTQDDQGRTSNVLRVPVAEGRENEFRWQDGVLYYALTDRFSNGDEDNDAPIKNPDVLPPANYHGGDLAGIREKIDSGYFERLGVNTIWLAPLNRNPDKAYREYPEPHRWYTGYHGYWPVSATEIDPHFGTADDLRALVHSAHVHGLQVLADLVLHHVHEDHPWWKEHPDWFGSLALPDGRQNLRLWDEQQFTTWFEPFLPSFDFSKDEPTQALIDNAVWWAETFDLDGFRLDAVKHILPRFWWQFRAALRERIDAKRARKFYLVGETFKDRPGIAAFVGPNMLDGQFDFPLYDAVKSAFALGQGDLSTLERAVADSARVYGAEALMSPLVGNHDKARFLAYADGDVPADLEGPAENEIGWQHRPAVDHAESYSKLMLAQTFLMTLDGVPMVYYGDEAGMTGAGDPDNRRDMRFGAALNDAERGVLAHFAKLGKLRREHPALRYGSRRVLIATRDVDAFVRAHLEDRVAVLINRGDKPQAVEVAAGPELPDSEYPNLLGAGNAKVSAGRLTCELPPRTAFILAAPLALFR